MSTSSTIFKIRATSDYLSENNERLSFRKGQAFYALSFDNQSLTYFVSTQFSTPFSRTAVNGLVPSNHFEIDDLFGNQLPSNILSNAKPPVAPVRSQSRLPAKITDRVNNLKSASYSPLKSSNNQIIVNAIVVNYSLPKTSADEITFEIKVQKSNTSHVIKRTQSEFTSFHQNLITNYAFEATQGVIPNLLVNNPVYTKQVNPGDFNAKEHSRLFLVYLNTLFKQAPQYILQSEVCKKFFQPRDDAEVDSIEIKVNPVSVNNKSVVDSKAGLKLQQLLGSFGKKNNKDMDVLASKFKKSSVNQNYLP
ncbi:hypothetical protein HK099_001551, partial [Clydaea vesicula]